MQQENKLPAQIIQLYAKYRNKSQKIKKYQM